MPGSMYLENTVKLGWLEDATVYGMATSKTCLLNQSQPSPGRS
jgi:hypothetical protein